MIRQADLDRTCIQASTACEHRICEADHFDEQECNYPEAMQTYRTKDRKIAEVVNGRRTFWDAGTHVNLQPHNNALYFRRVTYQDNGEYTCEINGKTKKSLARLFVQGDSTEVQSLSSKNLRIICWHSS
ncbi:ig-like domain-containing protein [Caerostris extrusa]|uniref:Ig-like domain-containing protein n=1 Tax=Caerostris extrusa TaxID=172846 RepID=A0AAV4VJC1_CAEEX|nr:ig-like domain-containing protein [Caerostris extrusa]